MTIEVQEKEDIVASPEIWGGLECTINRVGNVYKDQLIYSGHYSRPSDIDQFAELGIKSLRYPVLWERHRSSKNADLDLNWSLTSKRMRLIQQKAICPIVGLVHHGSGPSFTDLLDPDFGFLLADYAFDVAKRFPWVEQFTPVNEPLTTARFSGLYGHWYPHHTNELSFYKMLLNELKATVLAMEAIRSVNANAKLIQTEDLGKTHSTSLLTYQAEFENDRRLLTFEILTGRLKPGHRHYEYMVRLGICEKDILYFQQHPIQPDILGLNYYVTSERWIDESHDRFPEKTHGGNGIHLYADTEVVRANPSARQGFRSLARDVYERYRIPMAVTEVHLHCTREEQMRWFMEIWDESVSLCRDGIPVKAVTAWALLGAFDWDSLLTKTSFQYESGVFDITTFSNHVRSTALTKLIKDIGKNQIKRHPVLLEKGWWHGIQDSECESPDRKLVIFGNSEVREKFSNVCNHRRIPYLMMNNTDFKNLLNCNPWAIINLNGLESSDPFKLQNKNEIARECSRLNIQYLTFSDELVDSSCLTVCAQTSPLSSCQIHKSLDLLIDEETGLWFFDSDDIVFNTENSLLTKTVV